MSDIILVYTTFEKKEEALQLGRVLLEKRLIACAQIDNAVDSLYWWNGEIEQAEEFRLLMKSRLTLWKELEKTIKKHHSYDLPEIVAIPVVEANPDYRHWIEETVRK